MMVHNVDALRRRHHILGMFVLLTRPNDLHFPFPKLNSLIRMVPRFAFLAVLHELSELE